MKKKQLIALLLCGIMAVGAFSGCGGGEAADSSAAEEKTQGPENDTIENGVVNGVWNKEGLGIVGDGQEFSWRVLVDDSCSTGEW